MKRFMKISVVIAVIFVLGSAGTALAASIKTPAEIVSELTGKTTDQVDSERASGKTYGAIANDAGKLDEFQAQILEQKRAYLDQRVKDGTLSQERADAIYDAIVEAQSICDGTGRGSLGGRMRCRLWSRLWNRRLWCCCFSWQRSWLWYGQWISKVNS